MGPAGSPRASESGYARLGMVGVCVWIASPFTSSDPRVAVHRPFRRQSGRVVRESARKTGELHTGWSTKDLRTHVRNRDTQLVSGTAHFAKSQTLKCSEYTRVKKKY